MAAPAGEGTGVHRRELVLFALCLAAGLLVSCWGVDLIRLALASRGWPSAPGEVVSSEVERNFETGPDRSDLPTYHARVVYRYCVDGRWYTGSRVWFGEYGSAIGGLAARVAARYPVGARVAVHYHPDRPGLAVLEPGLHGSTVVPLGGGLLFLAVGLGGLVGSVVLRVCP